MTTTPPDAAPGPGPDEGPRATREEIRDLGRLRRSTTDRKIAGVAGGLGRHLDIDPLLLRVALVVLVFFGGAGLLIYGACWLLVPEDDGTEATITLDERNRTVALVIVGGLAALALVGDSWGFIGFPWPIAIIGLIALYVLSRNKPKPVAPYDGGPVPSAPASPTAPTDPAAPVAPTWVPGAPPYAAPPLGYVPPVAYVRPVQRDPRRRGPLLFWFTVALVALLEGVLGIADLAGAPVADAAYPALALATIGAMLVVGAFYGRAGGLILLGLIAAVVTAGATAADRWDGETTTERPVIAADLDESYSFGAGELVIDLTDVQDLENLDGRTLDLEVSVGRIEVIVPEGLAVDAQATVHGPGAIDLFGEQRDGISTTSSEFHDPGLGDHPELTIEADVDLGEIEMRTR